MGLIVNFLSIIIGGILGLTIGKKFNEDIKNIIVDCAGIFIMVIGIKSALVAQKDIMILIYLIIGAVIGQLINIDKRIKNLLSIPYLSLNFYYLLLINYITKY